MAISAKTLNLPSFHLKKGRDHLINDFLAKSGGSDFLARHTDLLDEYFIECFENSLIGPRMQFHKKPYAIIALGGYGRQEQCLHSDIDILLLFEKKVPGEAEGLIREILYPLWDLGFDVGHATRSIKECLKLAAGDLDVLTALLDARFLCGMSALYARLRELLFQQLTGSRVKKVVAALIQNNHERHDYFGDSSYLLEPNLKEGQGGLRDYHTMLWVARIQSKITRPRDLEYFGYVSCQEFQLLTKALGFIWKVRNHLHHLVRRKFDQLYFEYQKSLALSLNFKKNRGQLPVELFLGKLHAEMEFIKQTNLIFLAEKASYRFLFAEQKKTKKSGRVDGLWVHGKLIGFESTEYIPDFPDLLLKIFIESARLQLALSWEARRVVKEFAYLVDKRFRNDPENVKMFEEILKTPAIPFNVLNEMLQTGFLERFIPAIKSIKNRIQYDGYHFFPIDRHSLRTVKIMKTFADKTITDPLLTGLYRRLGENKTALLWAALLHDIGKGQAGGFF
ncbi:MAG: HD domain-containing protein [Desulfobia sp.]